MAKIDRYNGNVRAFAADSLGTERTVFGATTQSDTLDGNITLDLLRGWGIVGVNENPTKQDFNGLAFTLGQLIAYLHQRGVPEWNADQEYYQGSVVTTLAGVYRLKSGGDGTVDPDSDGGTNWELAPTRAQVDAKADQATTYTETEVDELTGSLAYPSTTLASSSDISESVNPAIAAYPHIQGFRTGTGTALTFAEAVAEAAERGARLLTIQELEAGVAAGTGSVYDEEITWTSSPAGVGLVYGNIGEGNGTRVVLNTNTDTAAGGYAVSVVGQRQWTDTQYAQLSGGASANFTTMPQVGGDPVVESGSNADGEWTRWSDGTQIAMISNANGEVSGGPYTWTYPAAFNAAPTYAAGQNITRAQPTGTDRAESVSIGQAGNDFRTATDLDYYTTTSNDSAEPFAVSLFASGRWK